MIKEIKLVSYESGDTITHWLRIVNTDLAKSICVQLDFNHFMNAMIQYSLTLSETVHNSVKEYKFKL